MNQNKLARLYQKLLQKQQQLQDTAAAFEKRGIHENINDVSGELSAYDQHPADYGSQMFEREKDYGLLESIHHELKKIQHALEQMDAGMYGICGRCRQEIDEERLAALPAATLCIRCKLEEEEQLTPDGSAQNLSFGHSFKDGDDYVAFDGEDTWQAVARFGTANTPQDIPGSNQQPNAYVGADEDNPRPKKDE